MARIGLALIACLVVCVGCAGPRVLDADSSAVATPVAQAEEMNPFTYEWSQAPAVIPVSDEFGAPPVPALPSADMSDLPTYETPGSVSTGSYGAFPDEAAPEAPPIPETEAELAPDAAPSAVDFPAPCDTAPALGGCCGKCGGTCGGDCGCKKCPCPDPCGNPCGGYVGASFVVGPGYGGALEFGINFKRTKSVLWSWDFALMYLDYTDAIDGGDNKEGGKANMFRAGVRARFMPCCRWHPTVRAGLSWFQAGGKPELLSAAEIDADGDYFGGYVGVGLEFDINRRWSTGPEIMGYAGVDLSNTDQTAFMGMLWWHLNYKF